MGKVIKMPKPQKKPKQPALRDAVGLLLEAHGTAAILSELLRRAGEVHREAEENEIRCNDLCVHISEAIDLLPE